MTRFPGSVSGTSALVVRSPWSPSFPLRTPPPTHTRRLCSPASSVLRGHPTPARRARRDYGSAFPDRPPPPSSEGVCGVSRFSCMEFPHMPGVCDSAMSKDRCAERGPSCGLPHLTRGSARRTHDYGAEYPACACPCQRLTRRCRSRAHDSGSGWVMLPLPCATLSFATPCRFIPALSSD